MSIPGALSKLLLIFIIVTGAACVQSESPGGRQDVALIISDSGKHRLQVDVVNEPEEIRTGLMYRTELAADAGMLFDFKTVQPISMWMKNTYIPLDMAFIDEDGVIVRIAENTTPHSLEEISSGEPVLAVLEVNAGTFARLGIEAGDRVRHPVFNRD